MHDPSTHDPSGRPEGLRPEGSLSHQAQLKALLIIYFVAELEIPPVTAIIIPMSIGVPMRIVPTAPMPVDVSTISLFEAIIPAIYSPDSLNKQLNKIHLQQLVKDSTWVDEPAAQPHEPSAEPQAHNTPMNPEGSYPVPT
eukprot:Em0003g543a